MFICLSILFTSFPRCGQMLHLIVSRSMCWTAMCWIKTSLSLLTYPHRSQERLGSGPDKLLFIYEEQRDSSSSGATNRPVYSAPIWSLTFSLAGFRPVFFLWEGLGLWHLFLFSVIPGVRKVLLVKSPKSEFSHKYLWNFTYNMWVCEMRSARSPILGNPDRLQEYPTPTYI